jgi:hypothetical protein
MYARGRYSIPAFCRYYHDNALLDGCVAGLRADLARVLRGASSPSSSSSQQPPPQQPQQPPQQQPPPPQQQQQPSVL